MSYARLWILEKIAVCTLVSLLALGAWAETETNAVAAEIPAVVSENSGSNDTLRAYLQLQEQLHEAQLAIERNRRQSEEAASRNAELLTGQLRAVEKSLIDQRARESRFMVTVLSVFAGISFLAVVMTAYFQWRTVSRLADVTGDWPAVRPQGAGSAVAALGFGEGSMVETRSVEQSNLRLLGAIERLEKRILELEHAADPAAHSPGTSNGKVSDQSQALLEAPSVPRISDTEKLERAKVLLAQGQSMLNEDKAEQAVECFDEALALDPHNTEAMVKKGAALERMRKLTEAIECYDRAIALDGSMTIAYLYKGGLYNQMERFSEAVECYEQALRTQEKRSAA